MLSRKKMIVHLIMGLLLQIANITETVEDVNAIGYFRNMILHPVDGVNDLFVSVDDRNSLFLNSNEFRGKLLANSQAIEPNLIEPKNLDIEPLDVRLLENGEVAALLAVSFSSSPQPGLTEFHYNLRLVIFAESKSNSEFDVVKNETIDHLADDFVSTGKIVDGEHVIVAYSKSFRYLKIGKVTSEIERLQHSANWNGLVCTIDSLKSDCWPELKLLAPELKDDWNFCGVSQANEKIFWRSSEKKTWYRAVASDGTIRTWSQEIEVVTCLCVPSENAGTTIVAIERRDSKLYAGLLGLNTGTFRDALELTSTSQKTSPKLKLQSRENLPIRVFQW